MEKFFLKTIWGIIILGAVGSVIAVGIVALIKLLWKRMFSQNKQIGYLGRIFNSMAKSRIETYVLIKKNNPMGYTSYLVEKYSSYIINSMFLFSSLLLLSFSLLLRGIQLDLYLAALISLIILSVRSWWKSMLGAFGTTIEASEKDIEETKKMLKEIDMKSSALFAIHGVDRIMKLIEERQKKDV